MRVRVEVIVKTALEINRSLSDLQVKTTPVTIISLHLIPQIRCIANPSLVTWYKWYKWYKRFVN